MRLNDAQRLAVDEFSRDLLVLAGAGTGKTRVLTEKYLGLIQERRYDPRRIVAITFTQKAALEMRSRIRSAIDERIEGSTGSLREFWRQKPSALDEAYIGTFHGLCGAIIREFPMATGVLPGSNILNEGEERILLAEAAEKACAQMASAADQETRERFYRGVLGLGLHFFLEQLRDVYPKIRESGRPVADCFRHTAQMDSPISDPIAALKRNILDILQSDARRDATARSQSLLNEAENRLGELISKVQGEDFSEFVEAISVLKGLFPKNQSRALRPYIDEIHQSLETVLADRGQAEFERWVECIRHYLICLDKAYREEKSSQNAVDFADLQIKARDLLRDFPEIRGILQSRYDYFLVDEFQDTNMLQLEIIRLLVGEGYTEGRLFVVGDAKQSIYRFRGAQVEVVRTLEEELSHRNGLVLPLQENYRCHPSVVDLINSVSAPLFSTDSLTYHPLIAGRPDDERPNPRIQILLADPESDRLTEADQLADYLFELVNSEKPLIVAEGEERPLRYGDIAILFRAMTHGEDYTNALEARGIPFQLGSGSGYYGLQEVQDQLNLVRLVQNSRDVLSLLALLRSPYVGMSDPELFWMAKERNDLLETFYRQDEAPPGCSVEAWKRIARFREFIREKQKNRALTTVSEIIREALHEFGYSRIISAFPGAERKLANLEKLLHKADDFAEKAGRYSIGQFLDYVGHLIAHQAREGEANPEEAGEDAVRILTIHSSKGLEFPMVVLVDLEQKLQRPERSPIVYHPDCGLAFKIPDGLGGTVDPPLRTRIKERNADEEKDELKRLLYVAMTRARDFLILSGIPTEPSASETAPSWAGWIRAALPADLADLDAIDLNGRPIRIIRPAAEESQTPSLQPVETALAEMAEVEIAAVLEETEWSPELQAKRRRIAVTALMTYLECPRQYYLLYRLGLQPDLPEVGGGRFDGAMIGRIVHGLCAMDLHRQEWVDEKIRQGLAGMEPAHRGEAEKAIHQLWETYLQSRYPKINGRVYSEYPFSIHLGEHHLLHGIVDRIIRTDQGLLIVDFKTDRINKSSDHERLAEHYYPQLMTYALAIQMIMGEIPSIELYFLHTGKEWPFPINESQLASWKERLFASADALFEGREIVEFPPANLCAECHRRRWCPQESQEKNGE